MMLRIPGVLDAEQLKAVHARLQGAVWEDGRATAGHQSALVKNNLQLPASAAATREAGELILRALERNALFLSATLPRHIYPPLFNRYEVGMGFGEHVDNAVRGIPGTAHRLRTDVSCTLFLCEPEEYDGGELVVEDTFGAQSIRLAAGDLIVYPAGTRHRVTTVTRGARLAAFFWLQSLIRDAADRSLLLELDNAIRALTAAGAQSASLVQLTACYHNLLRRWADL